MGYGKNMIKLLTISKKGFFYKGNFTIFYKADNKKSFMYLSLNVFYLSELA